MTKHLKKVQVSINEAHDLGFCPINQVSQFPFTILNPNVKPLSYKFKFTEFVISPSQGVLMPNSVANFKIEFKPSNASVIVGTVILNVEGEEPKVYRFSAVGKYPYISVKQQQVSFDNVLVTKVASKELILKNSSQVAANFQIITNQTGFPDNFYTVQPNQGVIPPRMNFGVKVLYNPRFCDSFDANKFKMICNSGNQIDLNFKGKSRNFDVSFNADCINFGEIKLDSYSNKALTITNASQLDTDFEFFTDSANIFSFSEHKGTIAKQSAKKIIVEFRPRNTIAYYERVYCLIRNHRLLFVDLIGTCYDLLIKPVPLQKNHIDMFRKRVLEGRISEIQLKYIENNALIKMAKKRQGGEDYNYASEENFYQTANLISEHPYTLHRQLFLENKTNELISISDDFLEFGFCDTMTLSGQRQIQITNKLQCKLSLYWVSQKKENLNGEYMTVFQVYPESATLKPNVPVKFHLTFRPLKSGSFFFQNLQFFAIKHSQKITKKTLEDFQYKELISKPENTLLRNVKLNQTIQTRLKQELETTQVFPTLSGVIRCSGHSFSMSTMPYLPIIKMSPSKGVIFKPCLPHTSVYETIKLSNPSDTPIYFKMGPDPLKVFRAFPKIGLIEPKSFCIVGLQFTPRQYRTYKSALTIILNDMPGESNIKLPLLAISTAPALDLQDDGKIFFAPTSVGVYSKKTFVIGNSSKTNLIYQIKVPQKHENEVYFDPCEKQLGPKEQFTVNAYFSPSLKKKYKIKIPVEAIEVLPDYDLDIGYYRPGSGNVNAINEENKRIPNKKQFEIQVFGEGSDGNIKLSCQEINFEAVKISQNKKIIVKICNTSQCTFYIDLALKNQNNAKKYLESQISNAFKLDFKNGVINGNSEIQFGITFAPVQIAKFDLKLVVNAKERAPKKIPIKAKGIQASIKCEMRVLAQGNFPQLQIIDIRNDTLSVAALWQNFHISQINHALSTNLNADERSFLGIQNLTFSEAKKLENLLKNYEWNLGYVSAKSKEKPRKVIITVRNFGGTDLDYNFKFPSDNKIQQELWADPGEPTDEQAYEKAILDKKIFQIKPKIGRLKPGQVKDIELIYSPAALDFTKNTTSSSQIHMLRVVFQIKNGKSLVFNLKGTTLGPNEGLLTVKKTHYELPKTPIGLLTPLRFPIQINNVGSIKITYKVYIQYEEGQFQQVFSIQNPSNFLMAGENSYLYCLYKPLIHKQYSFKVYVEVFDFSKMTQKLELTFKGSTQSDSTIIEGGTQKHLQMIPRQRTSVSEVGSKVFFSIEDLDFGVMKAHKTNYRMIILYNMSKTDTLNFEFPSQSASQKMSLTCGDKFVIQPSSGTLQPNSFLELKLTLTTIHHPSNYEGEVPCNVVWSYSGYSNDDNEATQKQIALTAKKQTLFLRVSKSADFSSKIGRKQIQKVGENSKKSLIQTIFSSIVSNVLNDPSLNEEIQLLEQENIVLLDQMDERPPVWPVCQTKIAEPTGQITKKDYGQYEQLFLNDQFKELTELIMQNTFFNIIQETTHKQNDFLRISKKFLQANGDRNSQ